jgi:hypothetical protein
LAGFCPLFPSLSQRAQNSKAQLKNLSLQNTGKSAKEKKIKQLKTEVSFHPNHAHRADSSAW